MAAYLDLGLDYVESLLETSSRSLTPTPSLKSIEEFRSVCLNPEKFEAFLYSWNDLRVEESTSPIFSQVIYDTVIHMLIPLPPSHYVEQSLFPEFYGALFNASSSCISVLEGSQLPQQFSLKELQASLWATYRNATLESRIKVSVSGLLQLKLREMNRVFNNVFGLREGFTLDIPEPPRPNSWLRVPPSSCSVDIAAVCHVKDFDPDVAPQPMPLFLEVTNERGEVYTPPCWNVIFCVIETRYENVRDAGRQVVMELVVLTERYKLLEMGTFRLWGIAVSPEACRVYSTEVDDEGKTTIRLDPRYGTILLPDAYGWLQLYDIFGSIATDAHINLVAKMQATLRVGFKMSGGAIANHSSRQNTQDFAQKGL